MTNSRPSRKPVHPLDLVARRGRRVNQPGFTFYWLRIPEIYRPRIVVSHKVDKRATVRNKLRRRIRNILKSLAPPGLGIVVICRPEALHYTYTELKQSLGRALSSTTWTKP